MKKGGRGMRSYSEVWVASLGLKPKVYTTKYTGLGPRPWFKHKSRSTSSNKNNSATHISMNKRTPFDSFNLNSYFEKLKTKNKQHEIKQKLWKISNLE